MRILALDPGSSSIKAVEMDSAFGRFEVHDYHEIPIAPGVSAQETLAQWISALPRTPDRIVVALQGAQFTFRNLQLPTRDKKAIQSSVGFELEDELPFSADESLFDFVILSQAKTGSTVHVAATLKKQIQSSVDFWSAAKTEPDLVTTEAWAYRTLLNRIVSPHEQEGPTLVIQCGHQKTTYYLHWHGAPALMRDLSWGGQDLNEAISKKLQVSLEKAESMKLDQGMLPIDSESPDFDTRDLPPDQVELSHCIQDALLPLLEELRRIQFTTRGFTRKAIQKIYLAGGTALLPGLSAWIEKQSGISTQLLRALSLTASSGVTYSEQTDAKFLLAASLSFCLVGPDRANCINFRRGEFAKLARAKKIDLQALRKPLMALSAIGASLFLSLTVQSVVFHSRLETADAQLEKSVRSFFGQVSNSALRNYLSDTTKLKTSVKKELSKQRELARLYGPNPYSPLTLLNDISALIPKNTVVDLSQFQAGISPQDSYQKAEAQSSLSLTFILNNPQTAEQLSHLLSSKVTALKRSEMEEIASSDSPTPQWKVNFNGKPILAGPAINTDENNGK
jgi:general secretion pathway protein L